MSEAFFSCVRRAASKALCGKETRVPESSPKIHLLKVLGKSAPPNLGRTMTSHQTYIVPLVTMSLSAATSGCLAYDEPTVRAGLWKFERTLETDGEATNRLQTSGLPIAREMTRCVNPTSELKAQFTSALTPLAVGKCATKSLQKTDDGYVFHKICGGDESIKTEISVKSDSAYTEIHEGKIGKLSSKETVVAQRVGDCRRS
jgi:hypothetical protein